MSQRKYYFVYIITNRYKTVFYVGVTNNLKRRLEEHYHELVKGFSTRYKLKFLIHFEKFTEIKMAIAREKEIKKWGKRKKKALNGKYNPKCHFLNEHVMKISDEHL